MDWKDTDIPESSEPTDPLRVIFSAVASDKSNRELLMADLRKTTPFESAVVDAAAVFDDPPTAPAPPPLDLCCRCG